jgi:hypothetical protein
MRTNCLPAKRATAATSDVLPTPGAPSSSKGRASWRPLRILWALTQVVGACMAYCSNGWWLGSETKTVGLWKRERERETSILTNQSIHKVSYPNRYFPGKALVGWEALRINYSQRWIAKQNSESSECCNKHNTVKKYFLPLEILKGKMVRSSDVIPTRSSLPFSLLEEGMPNCGKERLWPVMALTWFCRKVRQVMRAISVSKSLPRLVPENKKNKKQKMTIHLYNYSTNAFVFVLFCFLIRTANTTRSCDHALAVSRLFCAW